MRVDPTNLAFPDASGRRKHHEQLRLDALGANGGPRPWKLNKGQWLDELLDLAARSERLTILRADLSGDFEVLYSIRQPVPMTPRNGEVVVGDLAVLHLHYELDWITDPPPPWLPLGVRFPLDVFHPNVNVKHPLFHGQICLGDMMSTLVSAPPVEIAMAGYFALVLRDCTLDETNPHGIVNVEACGFYKEHSEYLPLTYAGLCDPWDGWKGVVK